MPLVPTPQALPGISGLFAFRPETGVPMRALAQALLRGPSPLSPAERELIATFVSSNNSCRFCTRSHGAVARRLGDTDTVDAVLGGQAGAAGPKMQALLAIAEHVRGSVAPVPQALVDAARSAGADDLALHDAVLIAAAFSMFNRYVEGLGAETPPEGPAYDAMAERLASQGYLVQPKPGLPT